MSATRYYKAVRPDGTDFRTGTVRYAVGETTTHPTSKRRRRDDPSTYLSVSTVATDCTGFSWPCRLFVVEGVGQATSSWALPNKRCFLSVKVIEERPAWQALGPNGQAVAAMIERCETLTGAEARAAGAARGTARGAARGTARDAAWDAARGAARGAARDAARGAARDAARGPAWDATQYATRDAALALVTWDLATESGPYTFAHRDLLMTPWAQVIGMPEGLEP